MLDTPTSSAQVPTLSLAEQDREALQNVKFLQLANHVVVGTGEGLIRLANALDDEPIAVLPGHRDSIWCGCFALSGRKPVICVETRYQLLSVGSLVPYLVRYLHYAVSGDMRSHSDELHVLVESSCVLQETFPKETGYLGSLSYTINKGML